MRTLVITCEHGGNTVPAAYRRTFHDARSALDSHRGWDPGARQLAEALARRLAAPLFLATTSRLVIELNRSLHHPQLFSSWTRDLPPADRQRLVEEVYLPYRAAVESQLAQSLPALHLSVHSFTPVLDGQRRNCDIGLLYDPQRPAERAFCDAWRRQLVAHSPLRVRRNYPYRGAADGFTTYLRRRFSDQQYAGVELEVNQRFPLGPPGPWRQLQATIIATLQAAVQSVPQ